MFDHFPEFDRKLESKLMSVSHLYRGVGICKQLTLRTLEQMKANGLHLYYVSCSSDFTAKLCKGLGFEEIYSMNYKDYVIDGVNPVMPAAPHDVFRAYTKIVR